MLQKLIYCLLGTGLSIVLSSYRTAPAMPRPPVKPGINTIIIDAGHGGRDPGAHGDYSTEKKVCLAIALNLGRQLKAAFPDTKIYYTRMSDNYPEIKARADYANRNKGDLFISIHANAAPRIKHRKFIGYKTEVYYTRKGKTRIRHTRRVKKYKITYSDNPMRGAETYIWAADRSQIKGEFVSNRMAEEVDNGEYAPNINDPAFKARSLLWTKRYFNKSLLLATLVQNEIAKNTRMINRGVKQRNEKGIWVLQATAMPSILVETGYITNSSDEAYLNSKKGQTEMARAIVNAVKRYRTATTSTGKPVSAKPNQKATASTSRYTNVKAKQKTATSRSQHTSAKAKPKTSTSKSQQVSAKARSKATTSRSKQISAKAKPKTSTSKSHQVSAKARSKATTSRSKQISAKAKPKTSTSKSHQVSAKARSKTTTSKSKQISAKAKPRTSTSKSHQVSAKARSKTTTSRSKQISAKAKPKTTPGKSQHINAKAKPKATAGKSQYISAKARQKATTGHAQPISAKAKQKTATDANLADRL